MIERLRFQALCAIVALVAGCAHQKAETNESAALVSRPDIQPAATEPAPLSEPLLAPKVSIQEATLEILEPERSARKGIAWAAYWPVV